MKILLTGASGLLGRSLMATLAPLGELTGTAHSRLTPPLVRLDLTDDTALPAALAAWAPDLVVHSAAERRPDVVDGDPAQAEKLNVRATATLAQLAAARGARFVYISTDYVFDGTSPPYATDAASAPLNAYGRMKLAGEDAVRAAYAAYAGHGEERYAIVRIPILYGRVETLAESPVTELAAKVMQGKPFKAEDWAMRYPAHADDVARAVALVAAQLQHAGGGGVYHYAGREQLTKYAMARVIAGVLGVDPGLVLSDPNPPSGAPRPKDCRLDASRLAALGFAPSIAFADGVRAALAPFATV